MARVTIWPSRRIMYSSNRAFPRKQVDLAVAPMCGAIDQVELERADPPIGSRVYRTDGAARLRLWRRAQQAQTLGKIVVTA